MAISMETVAYIKSWIKKHGFGSGPDTSLLGNLAFKNSAKGTYKPSGSGELVNVGKLPELKMTVNDNNLSIEFSAGELSGTEVTFDGDEAQISVQ